MSFYGKIKGVKKYYLANGGTTMNTNTSKQKWILANANLLADVVLTEVEHYQRTKNEIKSLTLDIASAPIPKEHAILSFKPTHETRYVEYLMSYGITNPLRDGEEMRIHFYEEGMSKKSSKEEMTFAIVKDKDKEKDIERYRDIILAFLKKTMAY